ncbi:hypothetical protein JCGZ_18962 [Jatropha curcas]|uniref:DUF4378 domain-containing protein n=1 Tax=Jatropha curcas TaxID=180498 RepID=A0A067JVG7_JATCU|nr:uncharacterized protein LOC105643503 [Jatropha curcas]XP_020538700.1 uncharacterized protein LOC105643503 [Jatropha curcas]XP_037492048.1 uncharacterized protein LOC105643503 [Jatropha curcas]KDP27882.1 hypothetical protein JCGZ_18962 [Jatropha curcas]
MGVEKEGSKNGGGYVGGFFQLFDWKAKSRKKLFSSKSDLPARSKQGKRSDGNLPMTRFHLMDDDEIGVGSSIRGGSDYSCASSVTDDDGCGARAPGVVARLMGLDSMPTSSFSDPSSTPFLDTQSHRESSQQRKNFEYYHDPQIMYSENLLNKEDGPPRNFLDSKPQKVSSRPIEKFQSEVLPPKSAKTIPITHHKLLSPIKSPGFIPSKTAAHIMEAAARIIEPSPQATARAKISGVGSSSVPLKVRDIKERLEVAQKMPLVGSSSAPQRTRDLREKVEATNKTPRLAEASRRPVESNAAKYLKGQSLNKSWNGSVDTTSFRALPETEEGSSGLKNKGKSISLAIQAKVNVQRRENLNSSSTRSLVSQKDQGEVMSTQTFKSQPNTQKSMPKKPSMHNASGVLRQNNQKQNCLMDKDKSPKSSVSNLQGRKTLSGNSSSVRQKTSGKNIGSKAGTRKLGSDVKESEKGHSNYSTKHTPRKKRSIDGNLHIEKNRVDNMLIDNNLKEIETGPSIDRHVNWAEESKRKGTDVVSFTFTAPLMRSMHGYEASGQVVHKKSGACMDNRGKRLLLDTDSIKLSTVGYNVIGGDALSTLLEQKLRELTNSVESSSRNTIKTGSALTSSSFLQDLAPTLNTSSTPRLHDNKDQNMLLVDNLDSRSSDVFSTDPGAFRFKHMFQDVDEMEECSTKSIDSRKQIDCRRPSPISVLEPSFSTESCSSLDSTDCSSSEGIKQCSSIQAQEIPGLISSKKFHYIDADTDLSDSASSTSTGTAAGKSANALPMMDLRSNRWEIAYVQMMLYNLEFMFQDFAVGRVSEIIKPNLFNQLETQKNGLVHDSIEARLERKVLFDCVNECLDIRCRRYVGCGYETWTKGVTMVRRKGWLAEEVLKEISAWKGMGDCMVDELVDKDMSSPYGRWLDFEVDAFSLGAEIEGQIYSSLLDEVVADIFGC